ncbi:helix-turn-helix transcriptional regulator [Homoserinimonas sp. OAct 916]|uniref:helix-turn-helix domain-containing protein n=1 Tax=Homoserinimonas sp. OAct 916 TaxID=2211450 RepID=UPI000DBE6F85|nr:helix-turn-helix domain-containing protein [Homoserinimonas sp. OAct 916]
MAFPLAPRQSGSPPWPRRYVPGQFDPVRTRRAKAIRFSTLHAICQALECDVGDLLAVDLKASTDSS